MILLILFIGYLLRLIGIGQSFWLDEAIQGLESRGSIFYLWKIPGDFQPPLFHYLAHFWLIFGSAEWQLRLLPIFLGVGTIYLIWLFACELTNIKTANIAAFLLALSPFHIYYSQEFRPYALSAFLATWSFYLFAKIINGQKINQWLYILVNTMGLYSLYFFPFIMLSQLVISFFLYKNKFILLLKSLLISVIFWLPWLPMFFRQLRIGTGWANQYYLWRISVGTPLFKALPLIFAKFWLGNITIDNKFLYGLLVLGLFLLSSFLVYKARKLNEKITLLLLTVLLIPIFTAFLISFFIPVIAPKRLLLVLPEFYILLALGITNLGKKIKTPIFCLTVSLNLIFLGIYYTNPRFQREQWRQAVAWVEAKASSQSLVIFEFASDFGPWSWYQTNKVELKAIFANEDFSIEETMLQITQNKKTIFLFGYLADMTDPEKKASLWLSQNDYHLIETHDFPGVGFIYVYTK